MNAARPLSEPRNQSVGAGCLLLFGLIFLVAGCGFFWMFFLHPFVQTLSAKSWVATPATITSNEMEESTGEDGSTWKPVIHFTYVVDGTKRQSTTWSFINYSSSRNWAKNICAKYPVGSTQTCFYDPSDPVDAVLDRTIEQSSWFTLFPLIFVVVGALIMFFAVRKWGSTAANSPGSTMPVSGVAALVTPSYGTDVPWKGKEGPQRLAPATSRMLVVAGTGIFALIWNGISWPMFIMSMGQNGLIGFFTLFLMIFVAVGTLLICLFVYTFLGLFNPVVSIALSNGAVTLGDSVDIAWETDGKAHRISELTIALVGVEKATYTRGTDTVTDTHEFLRIPVAKTSDTATIQFGSASVQIPANTMHSFSAKNNKIEWSIAVAGVIRMWPDIKDSFVFFVKTPDLPGSS